MNKLIAQLAERLQDRYYGKYRGFVTHNDDPEKRGRLRIKIPSILGDQSSKWALPCLPYGGLTDQGWIAIPEVGAQVWVEFEAGSINTPIWVGVFWNEDRSLPEGAQLTPPTTQQFKTPAGHNLQFDNEKDKEKILLRHTKESQIALDEKGSIAITDAKGSTVTLDADKKSIVVEDANGNSITMDDKGMQVKDKNGNKIKTAQSGIEVSGQKIVVKGTQVMLGGEGGEPILKGQSFLNLFATHTHTSGAPGGPTSPPLPPPAISALSTKVKTS